MMIMREYQLLHHNHKLSYAIVYAMHSGKRRKMSFFVERNKMLANGEITVGRM